MVKYLQTLLVTLLLTAPVMGAQPPKPLEGFVPVDQLPPADQMPAAPLLIAAYAFVWVAVFFYLWTIWRRLNKVERELQTLERRSHSR
jgi:CcmD family protein